MAKQWGKESILLSAEEKYERLKIRHLPIGWTPDGKLICIPKTFRDEPVGIIAGMRGSGKTMFLHRILDSTHKYTDTDCLILNDYMNDTLAWNWGWEINGELKLKKIGERSIPLPLIHFYPSSHTLKDLRRNRDFKWRYKLSIPFSEVLDNPEDYFGWTAERDKVLPYFKNKVERLKQCKSPKEIQEVVESTFGMFSKDNNKHNPTLEKVKNALDELFNADITDMTCKDSIRQVTVKDSITGEIIFQGDPISACYMMRSNSKELPFPSRGVIPVIMTQDILNHERYGSLFLYHILKQRWLKKEEEPFKNRAEWFFIDEINKITGKADAMLTEMITRGRHKRFGMWTCTQNYSTMNKFIKQNKDYTFIFRQPSKGETKAIANDWGLAAYDELEIQNLKTHELLALTSQKFILYDKEGKEYSTDEPIKMTGLWPMSYHAPPTRKLD